MGPGTLGPTSLVWNPGPGTLDPSTLVWDPGPLWSGTWDSELYFSALIIFHSLYTIKLCDFLHNKIRFKLYEIIWDFLDFNLDELCGSV